MSSSRKPDSSPLGASWATWIADEEEALNVDSDGDVDSLSTADVSIPRSHDSQDVRSQPRLSQDGSIETLPGPELIMPSLHEDFAADSSWVVQHSHPRGGDHALARNPGSPTSDRRSDKQTARGGTAVMEQTRLGKNHDTPPETSISPRVLEISTRYLLVGILLALIPYLIHSTLFPRFIRASQRLCRLPGVSMIYRYDCVDSVPAKDWKYGSLPSEYRYLVDAHSQLQVILNQTREETSQLPESLQRSESAVSDLCRKLRTEHIGSRYEAEFECQIAMATVHKAREESRLFNRGLKLLVDDTLIPEARRMHKLMNYATVLDESPSLIEILLGRYYRFLFPFKQHISRQGLLERQYAQYDSALDKAASSQITDAHDILEHLATFDDHLLSLKKIALRIEPKVQDADCTPSTSQTGGVANPLIELLRHFKCKIGETYAKALRHQTPTSLDGVSPELRSIILNLLQEAGEHQHPAVGALNKFVQRLQALRQDWEPTSQWVYSKGKIH